MYKGLRLIIGDNKLHIPIKNVFTQHAKELFDMNEDAYTKLRKLWMWPKNLYRGRVKLYLD